MIYSNLPKNSVLSGVSALNFYGYISSKEDKVTINMKTGTNPSSYSIKYIVKTQDEKTLAMGINTESGIKVYSKERLFIELDKANLSQEEINTLSTAIAKDINIEIVRDLAKKLKGKRRGINWKRVSLVLDGTKVDNTSSVMFLKRMLKEMVFSVSKVEIPTLTFLDTEKVVENLPTSNLRPSDVETIISLKKAFEELIASSENFSYSFFKKINKIVAAGSTEHAGSLRHSDVTIGRTDYIPPIPTKKSLLEFLGGLENIKDIKVRVSTFIAKTTKLQFFYDGNKRTALVCGNKILIESGIGLISVPGAQRGKYLELLKDYYENEDNIDQLVDFLVLCIFKDEEEKIKNTKILSENN